MIRTDWPIFVSLRLLSLVFLLAVTQPAWSVTLDRQGTKTEITHFYEICPNVKVTKAIKESGGDRYYLLEGPCTPPGFPSYTIKASVVFKWLGQWGDASESIEVIGVDGGKINAVAKKCNKDPFVWPGTGYNCTGEKALSTTMKVLFWWKKLPLLAGNVPANQAYTETKPAQPPPPPPAKTETKPAPPPPPPMPGAVTIVSPTQNQAIPITSAYFELKFEDNPTHNINPDGAVKMEWQRFVNGQWVSYTGPPTYVEYYKMTQAVSIKELGKYRVRAMASPLMQWTRWQEFSIFDLSKQLHIKPPH